MFQKLINRLVGRRHFWRTVGFNELSEIYANQFLRSMALNLIGIFVPIYLYKLGYSVQEILLHYFAVFFYARLFLNILSARIIARFGPKHALAISAIIQVGSLCMLVSMQDLGWPIWTQAIVASCANSIFFMSLHTDFSKIKDTKHTGKELGFLWIFDRLGAALGPLIGGLLANFFDPRYAIVASILMLIASLVPLFATAEPVRVKQKITFKGLQVRKNTRNYIAHAAFEIDNFASIAIWPLFVGVAIFTVDTYAKLGVAASISTCVALAAAWSIGKLVDSKKSGTLFSIAVVANALIHGLRVFPAGLFGVVAVNIINDPTTAAFRMPYYKGMYGAADEQEGYRIAFITSMEMVGTVAKGSYSLLLWFAMQFVAPLELLRWHFPLVGAVTLYMLVHRYRALRP